MESRLRKIPLQSIRTASQPIFSKLVNIKLLHRSTVSAPNRRIIYIASLEAHVDRLHSQLLE